MSHYNPNQPRIPKGQPHAGEWTRDGFAQDGIVHPAFYDPNQDPRRIKVPVPAIIEFAALAYMWLSLFNGRRQAVIAFKTGELKPNKEGNIEYVRQLDDKELDDTCKKFAKVQELTNRAAVESKRAAAAERRSQTPSQYGTDVHVRVKREIDKLRSSTFKAEVSYVKGMEEDYGTEGSIRIDALEDRGDGTICVYDIKTGESARSGLSPKRRADITREIFEAFRKTAQRIILTEVRPKL